MTGPSEENRILLNICARYERYMQPTPNT